MFVSTHPQNTAGLPRNDPPRNEISVQEVTIMPSTTMEELSQEMYSDMTGGQTVVINDIEAPKLQAASHMTKPQAASHTPQPQAASHVTQPQAAVYVTKRVQNLDLPPDVDSKVRYTE